MAFVTHFVSDPIIERFERISHAFKSNGDCVIILNQDHTDKIPDLPNIYVCSNDDLNSLHYRPIGSKVTPGNNHFLLMHYFRGHPEYEYYWNIEYDVDFCGNWTEFFSEVNGLSHDFLSCHIKRYSDDPDWHWWNWMKGPDLSSIPLDERIRSFNPIYRISGRALAYVATLLSGLNSGHHEVLIPTALKSAGFSIADLGGCGEFTSGRLKNRFYDNTLPPFGTMRHRPPITFKETAISNGKLIHPCKIQ